MADSFLIINAKVPGYEGLQQIRVSQGMVTAVTSADTVSDLTDSRSTELPTIDVGGDWISQGGIDLQINGALGLAFPELNEETSDKLDAICQFLWNQGIDGFLPTIVTTSVENIQRSLSIISKFRTLPHSPLPTPHSPLPTPHSPLPTPHSPLPTARCSP